MQARRKVQLGSAIGAAVAVLLFVVPSSVGATIVVMTAPYAGVSVWPQTVLSTGGCGRVTIHAAPFFHSKVGTGGFAEAASSRTCPLGSGGGFASTSFTATVPVKLRHANDSVVAVTLVRAWVVASPVTANCTVTNTSDGSCYQYTSAQVGVYVYLQDTTTGVNWFPNQAWAGIYASHTNYYSCFRGSCSTQSANTNGPSQTRSSFTWVINVTSAHPADAFALFLEVYSAANVFEQVYHATLGPVKNSAAVNAATLGNEFDLASISIA